MSKKIKDLEFAVDDPNAPGVRKEHIFDTFEKALAFAVEVSISTGSSVNVDVLAWSRAAAEKWQTGGGELYDQDSEASVFQRIKISAQDLGMVP